MGRAAGRAIGGQDRDSWSGSHLERFDDFCRRLSRLSKRIVAIQKFSRCNIENYLVGGDNFLAKLALLPEAATKSKSCDLLAVELLG